MHRRMSEIHAARGQCRVALADAAAGKFASARTLSLPARRNRRRAKWMPSSPRRMPRVLPRPGRR